MSVDELLRVEGLRVSFATEAGRVQAVDDVSFALDPGEVLAVVGESGSGKSVTALSLTGLTLAAGASVAGSVRFRGEELVGASPALLRRVRGAGIAMVFQDPMTALNPLQKVGPQIVEQILAHEDVSTAVARERAVALLERVGIPRAADRYQARPHEFSGGMRQRALIAMALSCSPAVLVADEPTTALDVTIQAQILEQVSALRAETCAGVLLVTHDLGVVADLADRIAVMYGGRIVEQGTVDQIFADPQHPYTWGLLGSIARLDRPRPPRLPAIAGAPPSPLDLPAGCHFRARCPHAFAACVETPALERRGGETGHVDRCWLAVGDKRERREVAGRIGLAPVADGSAAAAPSAAEGERAAAGPSAAEDERAAADAGATNGHALLDVRHLELHFPIRSGLIFGRETGRVHAVDDVTLELRAGETLGLVGESGCGKSTLARCLLRLLEPTGGELRIAGHELTHAGRRRLAPLRSAVQMVFQDPYASLNPRQRVVQIVGAGLRRNGMRADAVRARVAELLAQVGLGREHLDRYPHEFSGGQRQRIGLARALSLEPQLVVLDEPVSALDVSIQAQIVNLLADLQQRLGIAYLFVAHDLSVVRHVSDRIAVMYLGKLVELGPADALCARPIHHYTSALLAAVPTPDPGANRGRERRVLAGEVPNPIDPPSGCRFHPRCPAASDRCRTVEPPLTAYPDGRIAACHHPREVGAADLAAAERSPASPHAAGAELPTAPATG